MKIACLLPPAVALLIVAGLLAGEAAGADKKSVLDDAKHTEGVWKLVNGEFNGEPISEEVVSDARLTIFGDAYTVQLGLLGVKKGTQHLDPTTSPKQIDAEDFSGPTTGMNLGIYEFDANGDFRVCFAATGKERPTEFATKPGTGSFMHVWRKSESK